MMEDKITISEKAFGFSTIEETMAAESGSLYLGAIIRRYDRQCNLVEVIERKKNVRIFCD